MRFAAGQANRLGNRASNQDRCLVLERDDAVLLRTEDHGDARIARRGDGFFLDAEDFADEFFNH